MTHIEMQKELLKTEIFIKKIKDTFEENLAINLNLLRVSAPLIMDGATGLNDNLNGWERTVSFDLANMQGFFEVPQSLAKWKRVALDRYGFKSGSGLYTDMNAIRRDDDIDELHSVYIDQWDWEKVIDKEDRNIETLQETVKAIFHTFKTVENMMVRESDRFEKWLPEEIKFITSQELLDMYPDKTAKERENLITKEYGAVFLTQIGGALSDGHKHDGRAADYDDWTLNGDILFWYPPLDCAIELSSMGIRVCEDSLEKQLKEHDLFEAKKDLEFHKAVLAKELPYTIGGGIGQSRICMYFMRKSHIGEVQVSVWPDQIIEECKAKGITLL